MRLSQVSQINGLQMNGLFFFSHLVINETLYSLIPLLSLSHTHTVFTSVPRSFSTVWNWIFNVVLWSEVWPLMAVCFQTYCVRKGHGLQVDTKMLPGGASHATALCCSHSSLCHHLTLESTHAATLTLFLLSFLIPGRHLSVRYAILPDMSVPSCVHLTLPLSLAQCLFNQPFLTETVT